MIFNLSRLKNFDWSLLLIITLLVCMGLAVIYSVTLSQEKPDYGLLNKQIIFFVLGFMLLFVFAFFDYRVLGSLSLIIYVFSLLLLLAVLFFGSTFKGTQGWFSLFGFGFQPVEFAKLALIIFLAKILSGNSEDCLSLKFMLLTLLLTVLPVSLVILQPDFGSAMVLLFCAVALLWFAGLPKKYLYILFTVLITALIVSWFFFMMPYQKERIMTFLNPLRDPLDQGYNVRQSIIAIGSGEFLGRGLGLGPQSQLKFLPETSADFIFASLGEELGFVGVFLIFGLYFLFLWRTYKIIKITRDNFSMLLVLGITSMFFLQIIINIGMALGLLPVTGLPLPFISSGGSFLIISFVAVGILESVLMRNKGVI